jgi:DNA-binding winged helix-turn-helix (wHTH) protein/TolB-like protein/Flp pilus assembly protein TadD
MSSERGGNIDRSSIYHFGDFEVDLRDETLRRRDDKLPINRRMFQVLCLLIERRGDIVTKEEFFEEVWDGSFVEDNNLTVTITALRKVLGDRARDSLLIENIPRKGYRFIGDVEFASPEVEESRPSGAASNERPSSRRFLLAAAAILILIVLSLGIANFNGGSGSRILKSPTKQQTIAVLPFKSKGPETEYLASGLTDGISHSLGRNSELRVSDRNSTGDLSVKADQPLDAASELGVENVVVGEVERSDGGLIITARLININDPSGGWKRQFRRTEVELFATQQEIVSELLENLKIDNSGTKSEAAHDPKALELYMKGRYHLNRRAEKDFLRSVELFKQTIDLDPTFAPAYVGLSEAYTLGMFPDPKFAPGEKNALIRAHIQKALDIDPNLGEAYAARAINRCYYDWDFVGAESDYLRAIELVPSNATAHHWYAEFLSMQGRFDESYQEYDKAISLDPLSMAIKTDLALAHFYARDYDGSMELLNKVKAMDPNFLRTENYIFWIHRVRGDYELAINSLERFYLLEPAYGVQEDQREVIGRIVQLRKEFAENGAVGFWHVNSKILFSQDNYQTSQALAQLGEKDKAFETLEAAIRQRASGLVWLKVDPLLDPLRDDPRFADLMRRVGFAI